MYEKVLIVRFSSIGDIIFTTAVVEALKSQYPHCEIHYLTLSNYSQILEGHPHISRIIQLDRKAGFGRLTELSKNLDKEDYSHVFDLHCSLRSGIIRRRIQSPCSVFRKPRMNRFFLFYLKWNRFPSDFELTDELSNFMELEERALTRLYISLKEKERCYSLLNRLGIKSNFIALVPGAAWLNKIWTVAGYSQLVDLMSEHQVVILGGADNTICEEISSECDNIVNLCGKTDLRTSMTVLSLSLLAVGADTGLIHAAEALGTPVVMITGPTSRETGANVRHPGSQQLYSNMWCRPCSKNGQRNCIRNEQFCLTNVTSEEVSGAVNRIIAQA